MQNSKTVPGLNEPSFSVGQLAKAIGVHPSTVRRWIDRDLITHWRTPSGRFRIPQSAVQAAVDIREAAAPAA